MRVIMVTLVALFFTGASSLYGAGFGLMDKDELRSKLGSQDLVVLDVRTDRDWSGAEFMIRGAERVDPGDVDSWAGQYDKGKTIVLYCA